MGATKFVWQVAHLAFVGVNGVPWQLAHTAPPWLNRQRLRRGDPEHGDDGERQQDDDQ
jgi:hypothetical protein